jgi:hypothetical protein
MMSSHLAKTRRSARFQTLQRRCMCSLRHNGLCSDVHLTPPRTAPRSLARKQIPPHVESDRSRERRRQHQLGAVPVADDLGEPDQPRTGRSRPQRGHRAKERRQLGVSMRAVGTVVEARSSSSGRGSSRSLPSTEIVHLLFLSTACRSTGRRLPLPTTRSGRSCRPSAPTPLARLPCRHQELIRVMVPLSDDLDAHRSRTA